MDGWMVDEVVLDEVVVVDLTGSSAVLGDDL